jgi:heat shock protein HslJ
MRTAPRRLIPALLLAACTTASAEAPAAPPGPPQGGIWRLVAIGGAAVAPGVTLDLSQAGRLAGQGPCNRFAGTYAGWFPEFRPAGLVTTEIACDRLAEEARFLAALAAARRAEVAGDRLTVTGDGPPLVFRR